MTDHTRMTVTDIIEHAMRLTSAEKARVLAELATALQQEIPDESSPKTGYGSWEAADVSEEDIAEMRRDVFGDFPREDIV